LTNPTDCRRGLACLRELSPETVYQACERLLLLSKPANPAVPAKAAAREPARPARRAGRAARQSAAALAVAGPR
jgi:ferric-dicitrate binding protein FerR (iron transport regulator)